jgi:hypothetical protein
MAKSRLIQQHLFLFAPSQERESLGTSGTPKSKEAVAIDA